MPRIRTEIIAVSKCEEEAAEILHSLARDLVRREVTRRYGVSMRKKFGVWRVELHDRGPQHDCEAQ